MSAKKNKTVLTVEPGKQEVFITREFDAPARPGLQSLHGPEAVRPMARAARSHHEACNLRAHQRRPLALHP